MIVYDPRQWFRHFFVVRGSMLLEITIRVMLCVTWSALVVAFDKHVGDVNISSILHTLVGSALGLLLVFRTNASYDRFWEGRKLWGGIVNETRNLIRSASVHLSGERELVVQLTRLTADFALAAMHQLRDSPMPGYHGIQHPPLVVATQMTYVLKEGARRGALSDVLLASIDLNIQQLIDYLGGCERIRKTPLPFAYIVHLRRALVLFCYSLPFALVDTFGWGTVFSMFVVSYTFFGIEEIGIEIESPFGRNDNDLPLEEICETIHHNLFALIEIDVSDEDTMPEGL